MSQNENQLSAKYYCPCCGGISQSVAAMALKGKQIFDAPVKKEAIISIINSKNMNHRYSGICIFLYLITVIIGLLVFSFFFNISSTFELFGGEYGIMIIMAVPMSGIFILIFFPVKIPDDKMLKIKNLDNMRYAKYERQINNYHNIRYCEFCYIIFNKEGYSQQASKYGYIKMLNFVSK